MGYESPMSLKIEINIENELGVFEPRDDVAGHILIKTEEDTEIDSCIVWLYGLAKTRWNIENESYMNRPGSLASGINLSRSISNLKKFTNTNVCITENKICKLLSNASNVLKQTKSCKSYETVSPRTHLTCCTDRGYLSDTHFKSNCNYNHSSCALDHDLICESRIGESWISASGSFTSSLDAESSIKSSQSFNKLVSPGSTINNNDYPLRSFQQLTKTTDKIYDSTCLPNFCLEQWKRLFEMDEEKKECIYHGDLQLIYKSKLDLLKQYNDVLSSKHMEKTDQLATNSTIETLKNDNNLNKNPNDIELHYDKFSLNEQTNKHILSNNTNKKYHDLLNDNNNTSEKLQSSIDKHSRTKTKFTLTRGIHVFYFEFQLPADLPSTFELPTNCLAGGASASITYAVRIELRNNRLKLRHIQQREIIVFRPLELIHFPRLRDRITLHREFVSLGCCSHPSGLILCDLAVNKTGFVPGETIIPQVHITNRSSRAIQTVHLTFAQTVFLKGINKQNHIEVLRIFATRLNAQSTLSGYNLFEQLDMNKISGVFSSSNSFSSRSSTNRFERSEQQQKTHRHISVNSKNDKQIKSQTKHKHRQKLHQNSLSTNIIAVPDQGGQAYFTDLIHVPPLPTSGLFGRQNLIYLEYSLILRLRMQGDREGKHDHCMQIPITIGSDPTRETSFIGNDEVVPCYASFDFASGDIIEYDPLNQSNSIRLTPVYRYFKPKPIEQSPNKLNNIKFSSNSPLNNNNNSVKSLQILSKSSPSILKQPNIINTSTNNILITKDNHQNSLKSTKSLSSPSSSSSSLCHDKEFIPQKQYNQSLNNTTCLVNNNNNDVMITTIPGLLNSDDPKSENYSHKQFPNKKLKPTSLNKLKRQNNIQDITPIHKMNNVNSIDLITMSNESPQLRLSNQQYFDDGNITLRDITIMNIENKINSLSSKLKSLKKTQSDAFNLSKSKKQNHKQQSLTNYHQKYSEKNEKAHLISDHSSSTSLPHHYHHHHQHHEHRLQNYYHHHHSSTSPPCLENSKLEYKCKSQTNIPIHQYLNDLLLDQPLSYDVINKNVKITRNQSNDHSYCYNLDSIYANQMDYTKVIHNDSDNDGDDDDDDNDVEEVDDEKEEDNENDEEYTDEDDGDEDDDDDGGEEEGNIPSGNNNYDDITSDEINKYTMKTNQFHTYPCDTLKYCTDKIPKLDKISIKPHENFDNSYHTDDNVDKESDDEDDRDNDNQIVDRINNLKDNRQIGDYEVTLKQYDTQSKHILSISHEDSTNENDNTSSDITDLYHKVQKISDNKQISLNYRFKQAKDLYNAYWNCPKVAPIVGRKSDTDGFWTYGHGSTNENNNNNNNNNTDS